MAGRKLAKGLVSDELRRLNTSYGAPVALAVAVGAQAAIVVAQVVLIAGTVRSSRPPEPAGVSNVELATAVEPGINWGERARLASNTREL